MKIKLNEYNSSSTEGRNIPDYIQREIPTSKTMSDEEYDSITDVMYAKMNDYDKSTYRIEGYLRRRRDVDNIGKRMMFESDEFVKSKNANIEW